MNNHMHPFGIRKLKWHCYLNPVLQLFFFSILRTAGHIFQFNSSAECSLPKCLFGIARNASNSEGVVVLNLRLAQYDQFYNGLTQHDAPRGMSLDAAEYHWKWKHFPRNRPFVRDIHRSPVNSPHKGQWRGALMFSLICALNKQLSKQSWGWWFETPTCSLWRHCNEIITSRLFHHMECRYVVIYFLLRKIYCLCMIYVD